MQGWVFLPCFSSTILCFPGSHPPFLWLRVLLCFSALGPLSPWSIGLGHPSVLQSPDLWLPLPCPFQGGWRSLDGSRFPDTSTPSHSSFLHQSYVPFCQKKKVSLSEKPHFLLPKPGTPPLPIPWDFASKSFILWVLSCARPLADTWHPQFGWKCRDFIVLPTLQRRGSWDIPSSALGGMWHNPDIIYWLHITWGIHT